VSFVTVVPAAVCAFMYTAALESAMGQMTDSDFLTEINPMAADRGANAGGRTWALAWPAGLFLIITFFVGADMAADLSGGVSTGHLVIETVALCIALAGVWGTQRQLRLALRRARELETDLDGTRADLARWRSEAQELLHGLGAAIDRQFQRWGLSTAECEVALLILKGLSYKEVAEVRGTSERTARHQAFAIYRKAGLAGRAEMSAFFLEDLLLPPARRPGPTAPQDPAPR
jgi:DNA-binding CsgD family transcriptional regulator